MPSRRRPRLVTGLAQGLAPPGPPAVYLGETVGLQRGGPTGQPGGEQRLPPGRAVWDRLVVGPELRDRLVRRRLGAPILLVDDLADSRWTMTVAGRGTAPGGAPPRVLPFALALTA